jgi:hypothetical protein
MMMPQSVRSLAGGPAAMVAPGVNTVGLDGDAKALEVLMRTLSPRAASRARCVVPTRPIARRPQSKFAAEVLGRAHGVTFAPVAV